MGSTTKQVALKLDVISVISWFGKFIVTNTFFTFSNYHFVFITHITGITARWTNTYMGAFGLPYITEYCPADDTVVRPLGWIGILGTSRTFKDLVVTPSISLGLPTLIPAVVPVQPTFGVVRRELDRIYFGISYPDFVVFPHEPCCMLFTLF